jgi:hypothetical protein
MKVKVLPAILFLLIATAAIASVADAPVYTTTATPIKLIKPTFAQKHPKLYHFFYFWKKKS